MNNVSFTDALGSNRDYKKRDQLIKQNINWEEMLWECPTCGRKNAKGYKECPRCKTEKTNDADESGYDVRNIEEETTANDYFRKVIYTGKNLQLVLMSLLPNEDIGMEVHPDVDQFFRIDDGNGFCKIEGEGKTPIQNGSSIIIKAGTHHNIIAGDQGLKLYTIYAPPNHPPDRVQKTKAEAMAEEEK